MQKLKLNVEELAVESFEIPADADARGTVLAASDAPVDAGTDAADPGYNQPLTSQHWWCTGSLAWVFCGSM